MSCAGKVEMDEMALGRASQLQQLPWVQPHCLWGLGAAEPPGSAPAEVGSVQVTVEKCPLLCKAPHSLRLRVCQPCAGIVPKLCFSQEDALSRG